MEKNIKGITLIALVVTIIVLLILAGITIQIILQGGIIGQAQNSGEQYKITAAREKLSITLSSAQMDKVTNIKYNQEDYLDEFIVNNTSNTEVIDNVVITDGYAFELDRSVPKIGEDLGKKEKLIFPEMSTTVTLTEDCKTATITINAKEATNGISKIEILQGGYVIETYTYENKKEPIIENYIAKYNGTYMIKVYANLTVKEKAEVEGLVSNVIYSPEGNEEYQKEHQVKINVQDETDKVISLKYQWLQTTVEPAPETFTNTCNKNEVIIGKDFTGTYYLWTLLEMQSGKINISRSKKFHFDNEGPNVTLTSTPVSENSFTLTAMANDDYSSLKECQFYINGELKETIDITTGVATYTAINVETGSTNCYIIVKDILKNETKKTITGKTKLYTWYECSRIPIYLMKKSTNERSATNIILGSTLRDIYLQEPTFNLGIDGTINHTKEPDKHLRHDQLMEGMWIAQRIQENRIDYGYVENIKLLDNSVKITWTWYSVFSEVTTYKKGEIEKQVTATGRDVYPDDGEKGTKWYVYKGIE
ncbi:MAG: hypothetical protein HFJ28_01865 [Clostridia bacterium]|nr:hypothetical protein [Clostridia bacterium]